MKSLYPLLFEPVFRDYLWGGHRLQGLLDKNPPNGFCAESWELVDRHDTQSVVANGPLRGKTLATLIKQFGVEILGAKLSDRLGQDSIPSPLRNRFPLLVKFLDANDTLSIQVHPNDTQAAKRNPPDLGKTEAWYVLQAEPDAKIFAGLKPGTTPDNLRESIGNGSLPDCLQQFTARPGDAFFIPAGTVHAIGAGLVILEIQQASDTTYRLFDWDRVGSDGRPRELHIEQALECIDFQSTLRNPVATRESPSASGATLVSCPYFSLRRHEITEPLEVILDDAPRLLIPTADSFTVDHQIESGPFAVGDVVLLPASLERVVIQPRPRSQLIEVSVSQ